MSHHEKVIQKADWGKIVVKGGIPVNLTKMLVEVRKNKSENKSRVGGDGKGVEEKNERKSVAFPSRNGRVEMWMDNMGRGAKIGDKDDGRAATKKKKMTVVLEVKREAGAWVVRQGNVIETPDSPLKDVRIVRGGVIPVETAVKLPPRTRGDIFDMRAEK